MSVNYTYKTKGEFTETGRGITAYEDIVIPLESASMVPILDCVFFIELTILSRTVGLATTSTSGTGVYIKRMCYFRSSTGVLNISSAGGESPVSYGSPITTITWAVNGSWPTNAAEARLTISVPDADPPNDTVLGFKWFATVLCFKPST
jgi:hypothetical protein